MNLCWRPNSPLVGRFLAEDAGPGGRTERGHSRARALGVGLHHGGDGLGGAERAADGIGDKGGAVGQYHS